MADKLLIAVMGHRDSGKSTTWNTLFGRTVKTGKTPRRLRLDEKHWVDDVFLVSGSSEERHIPIEDIMPRDPPRIVLCSIQYRKEAEDTFNYFFLRGYEIFTQWLNPGFSDQAAYVDTLEFGPWLRGKGVTLTERDGRGAPQVRVDEVRQQIWAWSASRGVLNTEL
jgi:hypothetical protein